MNPAPGPRGEGGSVGSWERLPMPAERYFFPQHCSLDRNVTITELIHFFVNRTNISHYHRKH